MASWITAQLKAAEGLLEAVDKTVSRTVGTLGLAEGDAEQLTPEYGLSRSTANLHQAAVAAGSYAQAYSSPSAGSSAYPSSTANHGASGLGSPATGSYYSSAAAAPAPWEARSTAGAFAVSGPGSGRGLTAAGDPATLGNAAAVGFTVKTDAPIPFGGPPAGPAPAPSGAPEGSSSSSLSFSRGGSPGQAPASAPASAPVPVSAGAEVYAASTLRKPPGSGLPSSVPAASAPAAPSQAGAAATPSPLRAPVGSTNSGPDPGGPLAGGGRVGTGTAMPVSSSARGAASVPAGAASVGGSGAPVLPSLSPSPAEVSAAQSGSQGGAASAAAGSATAAAAPARAPTLSAAEGPSGTSPPSSPARGVTTPSNGAAPAPAPMGASPDLPSAAAPSTVASPAPVAALASATTAAASTLASATSSAVTHSLSFFNLVLDDPDAPAPSAAPSASAAASSSDGGASQQQAQIQSLSRTCDQLRKRFEASRAENEQLEDMLARAEVRAAQEAALVASLREELAGLQQARAAAEGSLAAQLAVARASLAEVCDKYEVSQRSVLVLEGQLAALEESSRRLLEQHSDREGGMVEALRSELASSESRLAAEARAHQASRSAAAARELDLEQQIAGSTAALTELTRGLEEANRKCRDLEEELVAATRGRHELGTQVAALQRQLVEAGVEPQLHGEGHGGGGPGGGGGGSRGAAAAAAAAAELEVLRGELVQHQRAAALARQAAEASQAQAAALAQEVEALRASAEQHKDTSKLEAELREVSDMLYLKQTQMERLAAEKAAQQIKTERELESVRQEMAKLTRQTVGQGGAGRGLGLDSLSGPFSGSPPSAHDVIPMEALGEPYQRLVRHNRVGRAVKAAANFLDSTASTTSFVLRQYPLARLAVFAYALLIHLYVYLLIARMQRMATHFEAAAVAPSMGA